MQKSFTYQSLAHGSVKFIEEEEAKKQTSINPKSFYPGVHVGNSKHHNSNV